jgi:hypothetical protein
MSSILGFAVGLAITIGAGEFVGRLIEMVERDPPVDLPNQNVQHVWPKLGGRSPGGDWLGRVERLVFFVSFVPQGGWPLAASWLAFKVAAIWQGANQINAMPKWLADHPEPIYYRARMRWASRRVITLLVGTGANIVIAFAGASFVH